MSNKTFVTFAVGWDHPEKENMIRCWSDENNTKVGDNKQKIKLFLEDEHGQKVRVVNFFVKKMEKRTSKNGKQLPDYQFTAVVE